MTRIIRGSEEASKFVESLKAEHGDLAADLATTIINGYTKDTFPSDITHYRVVEMKQAYDAIGPEYGQEIADRFIEIIKEKKGQVYVLDPAVHQALKDKNHYMADALVRAGNTRFKT